MAPLCLVDFTLGPLGVGLGMPASWAQKSQAHEHDKVEIEKKIDALVKAPPAGSDMDFPRLSQGECLEAYNEELREILRATLDSEMFYLQLRRYRLRVPFSAWWRGPVFFWRTQRERRTRMDVCHS